MKLENKLLNKGETTFFFNISSVVSCYIFSSRLWSKYFSLWSNLINYFNSISFVKCGFSRKINKGRLFKIPVVFCNYEIIGIQICASGNCAAPRPQPLPGRGVTTRYKRLVSKPETVGLTWINTTLKLP